MDYPKILGFDRDVVIGVVVIILMSAVAIGLSLTHAQLNEETPDNISDLNRTACQLAIWEANASYHWNQSSQTCEKDVELKEVNSSAG